MKTKLQFGLVVAVAVIGFAASAQAGWSVNISLGLPVPVWNPPVVVAAPPCPPPPVFCPPVVIQPAPVVCLPMRPPCRPVLYGFPRYGPRGNQGYGHDHNQRGWVGYNRGGHR